MGHSAAGGKVAAHRLVAAHSTAGGKVAVHTLVAAHRLVTEVVHKVDRMVNHNNAAGSKVAAHRLVADAQAHGMAEFSTRQRA